MKKITLLESRVLHHDLYAKIESTLFEQGYAVDVSSGFKYSDVKQGIVHENLIGKFYIKAEGWGVIEDYQRIKGIAQRYNNINNFIGQCVVSSLEENSDYQELKNSIKKQKEEISLIKDVKKRKTAEKKILHHENKLKEMIRDLSGLTGVDEWLTDGIVDFIDTFMPGRINLRIYPFEEEPSFHILANLKRESFVDTDMENIIFAYGTRPNVKLTIFGLITSIPSLGELPFDPMLEFEENENEKTNEIDDMKGFEKGLRGLFIGFEGFEQMVRFSRYPNITIYPIAVYRNISYN